MSTPEAEFDLDKLFLPAWAQEPSAAKYAKYEGGEDRPGRSDDRSGRKPRRPGMGRRPTGDRPARQDGERRRPEGRGAPGEGRDARGGRPGRFARGRDTREPRPAPPPLPEVNLNLVPDEKGVESLARQIKMTGRAYPLFDIAQLILQKPERHTAVFSVKKDAEGKIVQPLFLCVLDDTLWLSEEAAISHVLKKHFGTFYQAERTATEPPKGKYTFVAQCGISGVILGPPNYHDYQNQLRKLHSERFSRMPFEVFKSRVKIVRDEEVVKKWIDEQSFKTDYICLNQPEPVRLPAMEAVEKHFRETHKENILKPVESHTLTGAAARNLREPELARMVRVAWEEQKRFPLKIATVLSQQFAGHSLQFFKVNKSITHVSVARPYYLDLQATPVSDGIRRIVEYINAHPKCSRRQLIEALAPSPPLPVTPAAPAAPEAAAGTAPAAEPTPEQTALVADLHWLVHQGHVIEFANGTLETAKKPLPKPPKPERAQPPAEPVPGAAAESVAPPAGEPAAVEPGHTPAEPTQNSSAAEGSTVSPEGQETAPVSEAHPGHSDETAAAEPASSEPKEASSAPVETQS